MRSRSIILALAGSLACAPVAAMEKPYRVSMVGDGFDGTSWRTGVRIELAEGWKTYWRMPGEAGIPPEFTWSASVPVDVAVHFPVPSRYEDASGQTVGYADEVVFPVTVSAGNATTVDLSLDLFFAVCKDICIPATAEGRVTLGPMAGDPKGSARVERAMAALPVTATVAETAEIVTESGRPALRLRLNRAVDDIFVETTTGAYFRAPSFSEEGRTALLLIDNAADGAAFRGQDLKLTFRTGATGLEQTVTLP